VRQRHIPTHERWLCNWRILDWKLISCNFAQVLAWVKRKFIYYLMIRSEGERSSNFVSFDVARLVYWTRTARIGVFEPRDHRRLSGNHCVIFQIVVWTHLAVFRLSDILSHSYSDSPPCLVKALYVWDSLSQGARHLTVRKAMIQWLAKLREEIECWNSAGVCWWAPGEWRASGTKTRLMQTLGLVTLTCTCDRQHHLLHRLDSLCS
jgi:hypothetical protein